MKRILGAFGLFGMVGVLAAANDQGGDLIMARRLIIVDDQGDKKIVLDGGSSHIEVYLHM